MTTKTSICATILKVLRSPSPSKICGTAPLQCQCQHGVATKKNYDTDTFAACFSRILFLSLTCSHSLSRSSPLSSRPHSSLDHKEV